MSMTDISKPSALRLKTSGREVSCWKDRICATGSANSEFAVELFPIMLLPARHQPHCLHCLVQGNDCVGLMTPWSCCHHQRHKNMPEHVLTTLRHAAFTPDQACFICKTWSPSITAIKLAAMVSECMLECRDVRIAVDISMMSSTDERGQGVVAMHSCAQCWMSQNSNVRPACRRALLAVRRNLD